MRRHGEAPSQCTFSASPRLRCEVSMPHRYSFSGGKQMIDGMLPMRHLLRIKLRTHLLHEFVGSVVERGVLIGNGDIGLLVARAAARDLNAVHQLSGHNVYVADAMCRRFVASHDPVSRGVPTLLL